MEYSDKNEENEKIDASNVLNKIAIYFNIKLENLYYKKLDDDNSLYIFEKVRGGRHFIVDKDNCFLAASSSIDFEKLLEEYKKRKQKGNLKNINTLSLDKRKFTLEGLIESNTNPGDPFWKECLSKYFNQINKPEIQKIDFLYSLTLNKKLFNEFTREIVKPVDVEEIFERYKKIINDNKISIRIRENNVSSENKEEFLVEIINNNININNQIIDKNVEDKVNRIRDFIKENLSDIELASKSRQSVIKGGRQKQISIYINKKMYCIIGNTNDEKIKNLYFKLKEEILNIINN